MHIVVYVHILLLYNAFYAKNKNDKSVYTKAEINIHLEKNIHTLINNQKMQLSAGQPSSKHSRIKKTCIG